MMFVTGLMVAMLAPTAGSGVKQENQFRSEMIAQFRLAQPASQFLPGSEPLVVVKDAKKASEATINLHNLYRYCAAASKVDCETNKADFVRKMSIVIPPPTPSQLRIMVRDSEYVAYLEQVETAEAGKAFAYRRKIGDDLYVLLAFDTPEAIVTVGDKQLEEMRLTAADAWKTAEANTKAILPPIPEPAKLKQQAMAFQDFPYLSALVADLAAWQKVAAVVGNDLMMTVVSDQFVFVGQIPDGPNLTSFKATVVEDCAAQPRCVSPHVYRFRDGRWVIAN